MTDTTKVKANATLPLPAAPVIPASNASYQKIIDAITKAAAHGPAAVAHVRDTIGGVNTYAKMVRRYADGCIDALNGKAPEVKPGEVLKAEAKAKVAAITGPAPGEWDQHAIVTQATDVALKISHARNKRAAGLTGTAKPKKAPAKRKAPAKKAVG